MIRDGKRTWSRNETRIGTKIETKGEILDEIRGGKGYIT